MICKACSEIEEKVVSSALSAFPFERVIQDQVCLIIESALSAFDFEGGGVCESESCYLQLDL